MQNALKYNEARLISVCKTLKIKIEKRGPNNSDFLQNWFQPEIRPPFLACRNFKGNGYKSDEWQWIWVYKTFEIEIKKGVPTNSDFLQNWFPPEIRSPPF